MSPVSAFFSIVADRPAAADDPAGPSAAAVGSTAGGSALGDGAGASDRRRPAGPRLARGAAPARRTTQFGAGRVQRTGGLQLVSVQIM